MSLFAKKGERVLYLPLEQVKPNPDQPRATFDKAGLQELAASIQAHGILQPLTVRREKDGSYTLIAGERRLRAAKLAGLKEVPCLPVGLVRRDSALLALVENIQRRDLDCWEEADAIQRLMRLYGLSQEQVASHIGKSQPAVANKLRLLKLSSDIRDQIRRNHLTERHARALLRLPDTLRADALSHIISHQLNVAATDRYIDTLLLSPAPAPAKKSKKPTIFLRDVRLFLNTMTRGVTALNHSGLAACCQKEDTEDAIVLTIRIPKQASTQEQAG